jgi:hypothetical protein
MGLGSLPLGSAHPEWMGSSPTDGTKRKGRVVRGVWARCRWVPLTRNGWVHRPQREPSGKEE